VSTLNHHNKTAKMRSLNLRRMIPNLALMILRPSLVRIPLKVPKIKRSKLPRLT